MNNKAKHIPTVKGWGEIRKMQKVYPGGWIYFDLFDKEGIKLDSAIPEEGEARKAFAERISEDYEWRTGAPLPPGCKLVYSETYG